MSQEFEGHPTPPRAIPNLESEVRVWKSNTNSTSQTSLRLYSFIKVEILETRTNFIRAVSLVTVFRSSDYYQRAELHKTMSQGSQYLATGISCAAYVTRCYEGLWDYLYPLNAPWDDTLLASWHRWRTGGVAALSGSDTVIFLPSSGN